MSEENNTDFLENIDLTGVDTSMPVLRDGQIVEMVLDKGEVKTSMKPGKEGNKNLFLTFKTLGVTISDAGIELNAGFPIRDIVSLTETANYDPTKNLARIQEAILGEKRNGFRLSDLAQKPFKAVVKVEESTDFGKQNRIKFIHKDKQG